MGTKAGHFPSQERERERRRRRRRRRRLERKVLCWFVCEWERGLDDKRGILFLFRYFSSTEEQVISPYEFLIYSFLKNLHFWVSNILNFYIFSISIDFSNAFTQSYYTSLDSLNFPPDSDTDSSPVWAFCCVFVIYLCFLLALHVLGKRQGRR